MAKVCILGGGSWGIGLSVVLHKNGHEVTVWSAVPAEIQMLQEKHEHKMLPGVKLPEDMIFTTDDKQAIEGKDLLVMAVASSYTRSTAHRISPLVAQGQKIVSVSKGIEEHTLMTATLEEAASLVHYSPAYLSSAFKADTGVSFSRYLLQVRMEQAMRMLSDRSVKFYEIADAVGYLNPKNLTRNFKEYYGITPQEFRAGKQPEVNPENRGPLS